MADRKLFLLKAMALAAALGVTGAPLAQVLQEDEPELEQLGESRLYDLEGQTLYTEDDEPIGTITELNGEDAVIVQPLDAAEPPVAVPSERITIIAGRAILSEPLLE
jgi:ribosomal 30S subunit maturation factor RimM